MDMIGCPTFSSQLVIDLSALRANYRVLRDHVSPAECAAVVKADAYGLGARPIVSALYREGCRTFFAAQLCEAMDLHPTLSVDCTIFILNGIDPGGEAAYADAGFVPVLNSHVQIERWRSEARRRCSALPAAIQIETGMSRLGISEAVVEQLAEDRSLSDELDLRLVLTHLACADEPRLPVNEEQLRRFHKLADRFPGVPRSIANSCGTFLSGAYHLELVRPGIALYGVPPQSEYLGIMPAVSLRSRIIQIRQLPGGSAVGYGHTYATPNSRRLATIGVGYADGWPRRLGNVGAAWFRDIRLPIVGRISMDSMTIDISDVAAGDLHEGDFVDLIGPMQSLEDVAGDAETIPYEILTQLGRRHARVYLDGNAGTALTPGDGR